MNGTCVCAGECTRAPTHAGGSTSPISLEVGWALGCYRQLLTLAPPKPTQTEPWSRPQAQPPRRPTPPSHPPGQLPRSQEPGIRLQLARLPAAPAGPHWPTAQPAHKRWPQSECGAFQLSLLAPTGHQPLQPRGCGLGREAGRVDEGALTH